MPSRKNIVIAKYFFVTYTVTQGLNPRREKMFRLWAKIFKDNHLMEDVVICNDKEDTRTHKVFQALDEACYELDLTRPIWLDLNIKDFKRHSKTRFTQDSFIEHIDFDYLEIQVIEED